MINSIIQLFTPWLWETTYAKSPRIVQRHKITDCVRSTMYDMCYGGTYWVNGDDWSEDDE